MTFPFANLPDNLAAFCAALRRDHRFRIGPRELQDAARALELTAIADQRAVRNALRPVLSRTVDDVRAFDRAFDRFFLGYRLPTPDLERAEAGRRHQASAATTPLNSSDEREARLETAHLPDSDDFSPSDIAVREIADIDDDAPAGLLRASYSPLAAEGTSLDLEPLDDAWRTAAAALMSHVRLGLSRRWRRAARGRRFDFRRTLRGSLHTGGDVVTPRWRARPRRRPRFVLLIDGSRSMESSTRPALHTAVALTAVSRETETFAFSTSVRRITRQVRLAAAGRRQRLRLQQAWGGGTTIGACLNGFLRGFGERLLSPNTIVIIVSDGLDVGGSTLLRQAMAELSRRAAALVWINPLVATPGYEPSATGMSAARPFVSVLTAVDTPAALSSLPRRIHARC